MLPSVSNETLKSTVVVVAEYEWATVTEREIFDPSGHAMQLRVKKPRETRECGRSTDTTLDNTLEMYVRRVRL
jgi:hypothetical protein